MSILIKGMEMPTSCRACHLKMNCDDCEGFECVCVPLHQQIGYLDDLLTDKRRDDCPLIPVPPHGDLIDASTKITVQTYDDMDDEYYEEECTIADALDHWSYEGCPKVIIPAEEGET